MAWVVQTISRTSSGKAWNGATFVPARRQLWPIAAYSRPPSPASKAAKAFSAAAAPGARETSLSAVATALRSLWAVKSRLWRGG